MCGIAGYVSGSRLPLPRAVTALRHRGPDDEGLWEGTLAGLPAALGHRRLSVIDLSPLGHQPMETPDGRLRVVFNGEIYNYRELRRELEGLGHAFRSESDTEVLLWAYRQWGETFVRRLRGMFAFALFDQDRERVILARDPLGIKPLYYSGLGTPGSASPSLLFASELKGILAMLPARPSLDLLSLRDYLTYFYVPSPRTIFEGLSQLPPGHVLRFEGGQVHVDRYWQLPSEAGPARPREEIVRELRALLEETVEHHLISDVPLGAFLSGGLDSSTLVALMARASRRPVKTFCMTFEPDAGLYDERQYARLVAEQYGTDHTEIPVRPDLVELLPAAVRHFDEPFGNPTALLVYLLSQETRKSVTVALAGDGGDELFLGYPRYQGVALSSAYRKLPRAVRSAAAGLSTLIRESSRGAHGPRRAREFLEGNLLEPRAMYAQWISYFTRAEQRSLLAPAVWEATRDRDSQALLWRSVQSRSDFVDECQAADLITFLPGNLLTYSDRMSMAHGLEVRVPFCDEALVSFMARLPASQKMPRLQTKSLLRAAVADLLPARVRGRGKLGFNPPIGIWMRGALRTQLRDILSEDACRRRGLFDPKAVQDLMAELERGGRDRSMHLWGLLNFETWAREYLD